MKRSLSIAITGLGAVSALGNSVPETLEGFRRGSRNAGRVTLFPTSLVYPAFEARGVHCPAGVMRTFALCLHAVEEALHEAGLGKRLDSCRAGVCLGTTVASQLNDIGAYTLYKKTGDMPLFSIDRYLKSNLAEAISEYVRANGPRVTVVNACSSGTDAIGLGCSWLRAGYCDIVIAGGADELNQVPYCGFASLGVVSPEFCAPFDRDRKGLNLGEGAGIVILEKSEHARNRNIHPGLFVSGYGEAADAYHLTAPRPDGSGLEFAVKQALAEAQVDAGEVSFVNAHGTATRDNDRAEGNALARILGRSARILSTKGYTGHALGAAGGLEAVFTALGLREGWIPASAGFRNKDPEIPFEPVTSVTSISGRYAVSTSLAFGGNNAALVVERE
ncbi:MAG: beta-ketoacyl-[acyl-carrier-protein] synthase family protein [Candidatus Omnitrophica bacterium]|nr:beta-ketoacyl-[acyl-carrier-protein] synthase family protein [Candidatus Omnitrophota bacterium]